MALLGELLRAEGHETAALFAGGERRLPRPGEVVVLPLPALNRAGWLNVPPGVSAPTPEELFAPLEPGALVLAGAPDRRLTAPAEAAGLRLRDYAAGEAFALANAVPTVEGALAAAMEALDVTLGGTKAVIVGAGRIGKLLALRLLALGADVTLTARKPADFVWAAARGIRTCRTAELAAALEGADLVFNTVPAPVFGPEELRALGPHAPYFELASAPGGIAPTLRSDPRIRPLPGLPGKVAPRTAARAMKDAIDLILKEETEP